MNADLCKVLTRGYFNKGEQFFQKSKVIFSHFQSVVS